MTLMGCRSVKELNKNKIYDGLIEENKTINIEYQDNELLEKGNVFVIGMNNKRFGANRQWDTISKDNKIIQDKKEKEIICATISSITHLDGQQATKK